MMLEDSGTDFFKLVDFSGSDSEPHFRWPDHVCMCIHEYKHTNGRKLLLCARLLYLASMSL